MRDFFGRLSRSSDPARDIIATKDETELASLPPPYEELPRLLPSTELPLSVVHSLKRCLIWRMAIDLDLKWYVPRIERPSDKEYARFESCCEDYGKYLGDQFVSEESLRDVNDSLWLQIFLPGSKLGIPGDLLEFFMFSVRRATKHPTYVAKNKRITCHRDEVLLLRLILDSRIIVDLVTNPHGAFARRLKAKCAKLHRKNFSWLLDPALINTDNILRARPASINSGDTEVGHWKQAVLLMEECERPCSALMDPSMSTMWRAMTGYFFTDANIRQQPGFINAATRAHTDRLPTAVGFGLWAWWNPDQTYISYSKRIVGR
ncbi:hypothetical protein D6C86_09571 [Aureobasidium pullulans]|uniref:Uncharacterized protein n=1 Tax=Aureobasidium pullulans TaxID=5580 RepID=A0A4S9UAB1_AURPU|nr:hypothetical protein D6D17_03176 [Aureobasidium pullulans]THY74186.1 hypothetical protein D6C94_05160 [Aureobasidium pullulans]THZ35150.1 hypothetical protein D6C87_09991 [Aureobasidium pullulans]THZ54140.1 hypothetical protein D6C86_09571 [Aureobasidium pullulans]